MDSKRKKHNKLYKVSKFNVFYSKRTNCNAQVLRVYFLRQVYTLKGVTIKMTNSIYKILKVGIVAEIGL